MVDYYAIKPTITIKYDNIIKTEELFWYHKLLTTEEVKVLEKQEYIVKSIEDLQKIQKQNSESFKSNFKTPVGDIGLEAKYENLFIYTPLEKKPTITIQCECDSSCQYNLKKLLEKENNQKVLAFIKSELDKINQMEETESVVYILNRT